MREPNDTAFTATIRQTHIDLRSLYLPGEFIKHFDLVYGTKYPIRIEGAEAISSNGTLQATNWMGGMVKLFRNFDLDSVLHFMSYVGGYAPARSLCDRCIR